VLSSQLKDNQTFATALPGAAPLRVRVKAKDGKTYVKFAGATNWAMVVTPDVRAGNSVVHIVKDVLLPAGVGIAGDAEGWKAKKGSSQKMGERAAAAGALLRVASTGSASKPCTSSKP
jgi:predicted membrane-bound mannosyltransferase